MCDIRNECSLDKVEGYKVVYKTNNGKYLSVFSGMHVTAGRVNPLYFNENELPNWAINYENFLNTFKNPFMRGRTSVFADKEHAETLLDDVCNVVWYKNVMRNNDFTVVIVKLTISGDLMEGTTAGVSYNIPKDGKTYAGKEVLSISEI